MAARSNGELAVDRGVDRPNRLAEPDQNRDGNDGNEGENQGILDQGLAFFIP